MSSANEFKYPRKSVIGSCFNVLLRNRSLRSFNRFLFYPFTRVKLKSEISEVVFLNWLVPLEKAQKLIPGDVQLISYDGLTLLTVLNYRHGHFRPNYLSFIKPVFGSPYQSNWRFYVKNNREFGMDLPTVYFLKNTLSSPAYSVGSRVFSNILHSHYPLVFELSSQNGIHAVSIQSGLSNSPDLSYRAIESTTWELPEAFKPRFSSTEQVLHTICFQDAAISDQFDRKYCVAKINLKFDPQRITPLRIEQLKSDWLAELVADSECLAFVMKNVDFTTLGEKLISFRQK